MSLRGRLEEMTEPDGSTTIYQYDAAGYVTSVTDDSGGVTSYDRDYFGQAWTVTNEFGTRTHRYDPVGNQVFSQDRNGRVIQRDFNNSNQLVEERWLGDDQTVIETLSFDHTIDGLLSRFQQGTDVGTRVYTNDAYRQVAGETTNHVPEVGPIVLSIGYDSLRRRASSSWQVDGAEIIEQTRRYNDSLGRLDQVTQTGSAVTDKTVTWAYQPGLDQPATLTRASAAADAVDVISAYGYDSRGMVQTLTHTGVAALNQYTMGYDGAGRMISRVDAFDAVAFTYDDAGQLLTATHTQDSLADEIYAYGSDGNRSSSHTQSETLEYEGQSRLVSDGVRSYAYDNEGNLIEQIEIESGRPANSITTTAID